jgi:hypothetical protein
MLRESSSDPLTRLEFLYCLNINLADAYGVLVWNTATSLNLPRWPVIVLQGIRSGSLSILQGFLRESILDALEMLTLVLGESVAPSLLQIFSVGKEKSSNKVSRFRELLPA